MPKRRNTRDDGLDFGIRVGVLVESGGEFLLARHEKPGRKPYWVLPGGRLEPQETIPECAVRELREETGLESRFAGILYVSEFLTGRRHTVDITARVEPVSGEATLGSDPELSEGEEPTLRKVRWVGSEEIRSIDLLPGWLKARILEDARQEWRSGDIYLGDGRD